MRREPTCPRCGEVLRPPSIWSSDWLCDSHAAVLPLQPLARPCTEALAAAVHDARVPLWLPWPAPRGWVVTGVATVGDERTGARALALACSGPAPLGGMGELLLVSEEPGIGLGARYAGLPGPDPGAIPDGPPHAKVDAAGHPTPLWCVQGADDRAIYVGEAAGNWLWAILWPETAGALLMEDLLLADVRDLGYEVEMVPVGALSPRLQA
jgi:hypothetical protein